MGQDLIDQGLILMLVGMGTVFVFLTLLVAAMSLMSAAVRRFGAADGAGDEEIAAIGAAITKHRER